MTRWIRRSTVVPLTTLAIAAAGVSVAHASCPPQDAVCLGEEAAGTGQSLVDDTIAPVDTPGGDPIAPVTVDPVLGGVQDRLHDLLDGGGVDPLDPIGGGGDGGGRNHSPRQGSRGASSQAPGHGGAAHGRIPGGSRLNLVAVGRAPSTPSGAAVRDPDLASRDRLDAALGGVARSLAIVLALFGLAVGFVAIQDRFDRNDPRHALAPVESDLVEFA